MATEAGRRRLRALSVMERVKRQETESRAAALGELRARMAVLERDKETLLRRITTESHVDGVEGAAYLGRFIRAIRAEIERTETEIARHKPELDRAEDALRQALAEQKTYEILRLTRLAEDREAQARREAAAMDEIGRQSWQSHRL